MIILVIGASRSKKKKLNTDLKIELTWRTNAMFADPLVSTDFSVVIMNHYQQNENMFSSLGNEPERKREMNRMEKKNYATELCTLCFHDIDGISKRRSLFVDWSEMSLKWSDKQKSLKINKCLEQYLYGFW